MSWKRHIPDMEKYIEEMEEKARKERERLRMPRKDWLPEFCEEEEDDTQ